MKVDKNTIIGWVLLVILFGVFFWYNGNMQQEAFLQENKIKDSLKRAAEMAITPAMKEKARLDSLQADSLKRISAAGNFAQAALQTEIETIVENNLFTLFFTNKGGKIKKAVLKKYFNSDSSKNVELGGLENKLGYLINTSNNSTASTNDLIFAPTAVKKNADSSQTLAYRLTDSTGNTIEHQFTVYPNSYLVDWKIVIPQSKQLFSNQLMNWTWKTATVQHEKNTAYERDQMSNICFLENNEFDYIASKTEYKFEKPVQWMSVAQQFFNVTLINKDNFNSGEVHWTKSTTDTNGYLAKVDAQFQMQLKEDNTIIPMQIFYGPNEYNVLKKAAPEMDKIVNLGRGIYAFVRPINVYIIMPVYTFFVNLIKNYGWAILLLTLFIRVVTAPLVYTSYLSGAKMKVLKPELDALKEKFGTDQQGYAMAQMKFYREAGVNPLGGCIPALLQIPIFFALYSFFNSDIQLRGQPFLWSPDLASYDAIITWKTYIWGIGNHISLFTITAVLTQFVISVYNIGMTPTQDNPALKYMPYIFPFVMFFIFNNLPSALTWYYTVSNVITLLLQLVIQKYIINHDAILRKIEEKRKAPKKTSKWQERYAQAMEAQKKLQELKKKNSQSKK